MTTLMFGPAIIRRIQRATTMLDRPSLSDDIYAAWVLELQRNVEDAERQAREDFERNGLTPHNALLHTAAMVTFSHYLI